MQSLLLQSHFVDDSDQIAVPTQPTQSGRGYWQEEGSHTIPGGGGSGPSADIPSLDDRMSIGSTTEEATTPRGIDGQDDLESELNPW